MRSAAFLFSFAVASLLAGGLLAQTAPLPFAIDQGCWLYDDGDGDPFGIGSAYQVHFRPRGIEFVPVLGRVAPHDLPLGLALTHVGRGEAVAVGAARREAGERRVDYVRPGVVERYELRPEGLEQSFVFAALPPGDGDLVVRMEMQTELGFAPEPGDAGALLTWPGAGGVHIGGVVGVDADGNRCEGTLRCRGSVLECVLPSAFVTAAALPLVLDPLLTSVVVSSNVADERQASVARLGDGSPLSAVVYLRTISASNTDAMVAIVNDSGVVSATYAVEGSAALSTTRVRIAAASGAIAWCAAIIEGDDVSCVRITTSGVSSLVQITSSVDVMSGVVVAGGTGTTVYVAWLDETTDAIFGRLVDIGAAGTPQLQATSQLVNDTSLFSSIQELELPRDSATSKLLLTYSTRSSVTNLFSLRGLFFTAATPAVASGSTFAIAGSANTSASVPTVAGDGKAWVVAYRTQSTVLGNGASCVPVHQNGTSAVLGAARLLVANGTDVADLDAAWAGGSALVAFARANGAFYDVVLASVDPLNCADCEGVLTVDAAGNDSFVGVAAAADGNAAVVWTPVTGGLGNVSLRRFRADDGGLATVGTGPFGTYVAATCARVGRADFGIELHGGTANTPTFALLASDRIDAPCGAGNVIVPDLFGGYLAAAGNTGAGGDLRLPLAIPNVATLSGVSMFVQFAKLGSTCFSAFDLSNAVQFTIQ